jgi:glycosyltransferase involved in cell wall biosynthesis
VIWNRDNSVAQARNKIAQEALARDADWIWWLDDDLIFRPDALERMLARNVDILIGLSMMRSTIQGDWWPNWSVVNAEKLDGKMAFYPVTTMHIPPNGLLPIKTGTGGGVLTRRAVFDRLTYPYWQMGQHVPDQFWEDIYFYEQCERAGFRIWGDTTVPFGHETTVTLWPNKMPTGEWGTVIANGFEPMKFVEWPRQPVEEPADVLV